MIHRFQEDINRTYRCKYDYPAREKFVMYINHYSYLVKQSKSKK